MKPDGAVRLHAVPVTFAQACEFVTLHHRHHKKPVGHKFSLAVADESGTVRGVAIVGRPVSRHMDDGLTLEVNRVATDGCPNACSKLYALSRRVAATMGYRRVITYTLPSEGGVTLRADGWRFLGVAGGGAWIYSQDGRREPRRNEHPLGPKWKWEAILPLE